MADIIKINDTTAAEVGTQEVRRVFSLEDLNRRKTRLTEDLAKVNALLEILK